MTERMGKVKDESLRERKIRGSGSEIERISSSPFSFESSNSTSGTEKTTVAFVSGFIAVLLCLINSGGYS